MIIATNVSALNVLANLQTTGNEVAQATEQLSSGFRINSASDDPAGLAIVNDLAATGAALSQAQQNAQQGSAMLQIADGGAQSISSIVDRMKELAEQGASSTVGTAGANLDAEFQALNSEITSIIGTTQYQGTSLLTSTAGATAISGGTYTNQGSDIASVSLSGAAASSTFTFGNATADNGVVTLIGNTGGTLTTQSLLAAAGAQTLDFTQLGVTITTAGSFGIGAASAAGSGNGDTIFTGSAPGGSSSLTFRLDATGTSADTITVNLGSISALSGSVNVASQSAAASALTSVGNLETQVNTYLGNLGAAESRLNYATSNLTTEATNTAAAESAIKDVDMASEMSIYSSANILQQAGTSMLAQANSNAQDVLKLFQ